MPPFVFLRVTACRDRILAVFAIRDYSQWWQVSAPATNRLVIVHYSHQRFNQDREDLPFLIIGCAGIGPVVAFSTNLALIGL